MGDFGKKVDKFVDVFVNGGGYENVILGLKNTMLIAIVGLLVGVVIGMIIATVRVVPKTNGLVKFLNGVCGFYVHIS